MWVWVWPLVAWGVLSVPLGVLVGRRLKGR
jgi:hypothetical protein